MQEITSLQNPIIKETTALHQKKCRTESGMFLIEGLKGVNEALNSGLEIKYIFVNRSSKINFLNFPEEKLYFADEKILKKISTTETPPEIVAVANQKKFVLKDLFKEKNPLILVLENIKDAGNLGTIIRTAKASNISGIILTGECIDIYNPKVVRSSATNLWKIPVVFFKETGIIRKELENFGHFQFLATKIKNDTKQSLYHEIDYKQATIVFFGSEAEGISDILSSQADEFVKIPMNEAVESLNLSISAGIIMYEAFKQRKA
ncbi:MAG: RNA methyltransferase [bacterium]